MSEYTVRDGIIRDPGKFEGEPIYVPYFYDLAGNGASSETIDDGSIAFDCFIIDDDDRAKFPDLANVYAVAIWERSDGFVECEEFESEQDYRNAVERCEANDDNDN